MASERGKERMHPVDEVQLLRAAACDWRLSRGDVAVLAVILEHCGPDWAAFPGPARIADRAHLAVTNVKRSVLKLESLAYLRVVRRGERKRSEYIVAESPTIPTRRASVPSSNLTKGHDSARLRPQFGTRRDASGRVTGDACMQTTGRAGVRQLGTLARHEVAFEDTAEDTGAARALSEETKQEQLARRTEGYREEYRRALLTHPGWAKRMELSKEIRPLIEDLIQDAAA